MVQSFINSLIWRSKKEHIRALWKVGNRVWVDCWVFKKQELGLTEGFFFFLFCSNVLRKQPYSCQNQNDNRVENWEKCILLNNDAKKNDIYKEYKMC